TEAGNINVNDALTWSSGNTLTLDAHNNIAINAPITATSGGLELNAGNDISASAAVDVGIFNLISGRWEQNGSNLPAFEAKDFRLDPANATFLRVLGGDGSEGNAYQIS